MSPTSVPRDSIMSLTSVPRDSILSVTLVSSDSIVSLTSVPSGSIVSLTSVPSGSIVSLTSVPSGSIVSLTSVSRDSIVSLTALRSRHIVSLKSVPCGSIVSWVHNIYLKRFVDRWVLRAEVLDIVILTDVHVRLFFGNKNYYVWKQEVHGPWQSVWWPPQSNGKDASNSLLSCIISFHGPVIVVHVYIFHKSTK